MSLTAAELDELIGRLVANGFERVTDSLGVHSWVSHSPCPPAVFWLRPGLDGIDVTHVNETRSKEVAGLAEALELAMTDVCEESFDCTEEEMRWLQRQAANRGITVGQYVRRRLMETGVIPFDPKKESS